MTEQELCLYIARHEKWADLAYEAEFDNSTEVLSWWILGPIWEREKFNYRSYLIDKHMDAGRVLTCGNDADIDIASIFTSDNIPLDIASSLHAMWSSNPRETNKGVASE